MIPFIQNTQSLKRHELIHLFNRPGFRGNELGKSACGNDPCLGIVFPSNALNHPIHEGGIAVKNTGLDRVDRIPPNDLGWSDQLNPIQFGGFMKERVQGDPHPRDDGPPQIFPSLGYIIKRCGRTEIDNNGGPLVAFVCRHCVDNAVRPYFTWIT